MSSITLSQKHGVNPSLEQCFVCGEAKAVILFGRLRGDEEAPRQVCLNKEPCDKCKEHMSKGVILISVKGDSDPENPYRTGGWIVVKDDVINRMVKDPKQAEAILKARVCFIPDELWDKVGFPRGEA